MVVTVNVAVVFVVAVLGAEDSRTERACEVVDMIFAVKGCNVGASECTSALEAQQAKPSEVISLAERVLPFTVLILRREELGCYYLTAVL